MVYINRLLLIFILILLSNCTEKISYSGKIINDDLINFSKLEDKKNVIEELGQPNFIDPIENKYYYFSEKHKYKNIFNKKIQNRIILVFNFDSNDKVISFNNFDLEDTNEIKFAKETTPNNLLKRGLMEKVFGGVGKTYIPNTP
tara:strand:- start:207 stop:638 length:432 start_codon:yes stop_codon:yes gene_type:complete